MDGSSSVVHARWRSPRGGGRGMGGRHGHRCRQPRPPATRCFCLAACRRVCRSLQRVQPWPLSRPPACSRSRSPRLVRGGRVVVCNLLVKARLPGALHRCIVCTTTLTIADFNNIAGCSISTCEPAACHLASCARPSSWAPASGCPFKQPLASYAHRRTITSLLRRRRFSSSGRWEHDF